MALIEVKNLTKKFKDFVAVDNISFEVEEKACFGLLGPNGAGKSTTISMLTALMRSDSGEITIDGLDLSKNQLKTKRLIGMVPQEIALYPTLTAYENLTFWGRMYGLKGKLLKERVDYGLEIAGLKDRATGRIDTFSGGMKRRINIAAALLHQPRILIMDEPTVGIDPQSRNHILDTVLSLNSQGMTIIYTSHYMEEVEFLCTKVAIIDHGKVMALGTKEQLKEMIGNKDVINIIVSKVTEDIIEKVNAIEAVDKVLVEENKLKVTVKEADTIISKIISILDSSGCKINSVNIEQPNLESVFLHLTGRDLRD